MPKQRTKRTNLLNRVPQEILYAGRGVEDHPLRAQLGPVLALPKAADALEVMPGHPVDFARTSGEDDALAAFALLDYRPTSSSHRAAKEEKRNALCSFPDASIHMYPEFFLLIL